MKYQKKKGAGNAIKRNPAAAATLTLNYFVAQIMILFNIHIGQRQTAALLAILAFIPLIANWAANHVSWLSDMKDSTYEDVEGLSVPVDGD